MSVSHVLAKPPVDIDFVRYLVWYVQFSRVALEVIAARTGVTLDPSPAIDVEPTRFADGFSMLLCGSSARWRTRRSPASRR